MSRLSRRNMLVGSVLFSTTIPEMANGGKWEPAGGLATLIEEHRAAYAVFMEAIRRPQSTSNSHDEASRFEEKALLAVCAFPATSKADRRAKATYLLEIETRGELDLREHMQSVLLSMI